MVERSGELESPLYTNVLLKSCIATNFEVPLDENTILVEMTIDRDDNTRNEILQHAQHLFQQFGLKKTTMEDIAKSMGKGKSTLYYYFCNKDEIFDAVIQAEMLEVFQLVQTAVTEAISAEEKLKTFAITKIKEARKKTNLYKIVQGEMQQAQRCIKHLNKEYDTLELNLVTSILQFGLANSEFNHAVHKEIDILPSIIISSLRGVERDMFIDNKYDIIDERMEALINILIRGIK